VSFGLVVYGNFTGVMETKYIKKSININKDKNTVLVGSPDAKNRFFVSNLPPWLSILRDFLKEVLSWIRFQ